MATATRNSSPSPAAGAIARKAPALTGDFLAVVKTAADLLYKGGLTPKGVDRPEKLAAIILAGFEIGLTACQSISSLMILNGRACLYGDAALALVRASGKLQSIAETIENADELDRVTAVCTVHRVGAAEPKVSTFSVADAKLANLWNKKGPWTEYPERMLTFRARGFALRDEFGDVLSGLSLVEEVQDYPASARAETPTVTVDAEVVLRPEPGTAPPALASPSEPPAAPEPAANSLPVEMVNDGQLSTLVAMRDAWYVRAGLGEESGRRTEAWKIVLAEYGVGSARELTVEQAKLLIQELPDLANPF